MLNATRNLILVLCVVLLCQAIICFTIGGTQGIAFGIIGSVFSISGLVYGIVSIFTDRKKKN